MIFIFEFRLIFYLILDKMPGSDETFLKSPENLPNLVIFFRVIPAEWQNFRLIMIKPICFFYILGHVYNVNERLNEWMNESLLEYDIWLTTLCDKFVPYDDRVVVLLSSTSSLVTESSDLISAISSFIAQKACPVRCYENDYLVFVLHSIFHFIFFASHTQFFGFIGCEHNVLCSPLFLLLLLLSRWNMKFLLLT